MVLHTDDGAQGYILNQLHLVRLIKIPVLFLEVGIDVPCIPSFGFVIETLQQIATDEVFGTSAVGLRRRKRLRLSSFVEEISHAASLGIDLEANELIFESTGRRLDSRMVWSLLCRRTHEISRVANRRSVTEN